MDICPCVNCICLVVCRHKDYYILRQECELVMLYTQTNILSQHRARCKVLEMVLKPTVWQLGGKHLEGDYSGYHIEYIPEKFQIFKEPDLK